MMTDQAWHVTTATSGWNGEVRRLTKVRQPAHQHKIIALLGRGYGVELPSSPAVSQDEPLEAVAAVVAPDVAAMAGTTISPMVTCRRSVPKPPIAAGGTGLPAAAEGPAD